MHSHATSTLQLLKLVLCINSNSTLNAQSVSYIEMVHENVRLARIEVVKEMSNVNALINLSV